MNVHDRVTLRRMQHYFRHIQDGSDAHDPPTTIFDASSPHGGFSAAAALIALAAVETECAEAARLLARLHLLEAAVTRMVPLVKYEQVEAEAFRYRRALDIERTRHRGKPHNFHPACSICDKFDALLGPYTGPTDAD